jgi:hypothetical protein
MSWDRPISCRPVYSRRYVLAEVDGFIFQENGAPAHFCAIVRTSLDERFPGQWIGRGRSINWPPRSPDVTLIHGLLPLGVHQRHRAQRKGRVSSRFAPKEYSGCRCGACGCPLAGVG